MATWAARRVADYIEPHTDALSEAILAALSARQAAGCRSFLREWMASQIDCFRGQPDRTNEWVALMSDGIRAAGGGLEEVLGQVWSFREALMTFCRGKIHNLTDVELYEVILDFEDRHFRHVAEYCSQLERETVASERRRQRAMAESMDHPFVALDPDGVITLANARFVQDMGLPLDKILGQELAGFCDRATALEVRRAVRQKRATERRSFGGELVTAQGRKRATRFEILPMFDAQGRRDGVAVSMAAAGATEVDVKAYIEYIEEGIIRVLPTPVHVIGRDRQIVYRNPACEGLSLGVGEEDKPYCCRLHHARDGGDTPCFCERAFDTGEARVEEVHYLAGGLSRWFRLFLVPIPEPGGGIVRVACILRDVSEERSLEKRFENQILEHQRTSLVSQLAVTVAHQVRNPLGVVIGFAEMLAKGLPPEQIPDAVDKILRNGIRCKEIVDNLLEFGQGFPGERMPTELNQLILRSVEPMFTASQSSRITWNVPSDAGCVECVPEQLSQVFVNLVENALRAARHQVSVEVSQDGDQILVRVRDDGPGVPGSLRYQVFQPFFTTHKDEGAVGLGLTLAQSVVKEQGGHLYLEEQTQGGAPEAFPGACFVVQLPAIREAAAVATPAHDQTAEPARSGRILVVDDELDLLDMLATVLTFRGYQVDVAGTAAEAIDLMKRTQYEAMVLDVLLPGELSGPQLFEYVSGTQQGLTERTLFITADTMNYETRKFLEKVKCPSMEKPFLVSDFAEKVDELFESRTP